ncbi:hypothetical protein [Microbispora sp. H10949]|uniref:hypothetical protein n=1 Tax=Microbispora sp. H10949 TaxID=2729111 RepID=UPI0016039856|nr:hypothetical protein [Microbispora sp. H10949]
MVGAVGADPGCAVAELARLVELGGVEVAGAGIDLGDGFVSARAAGARGDRRDAVLAALRVLGIDGVERLGGRATVLVALFGPAATKPVGAAAVEAVTEGRWAALELASAASDLLGPEQLERVLSLEGLEGARSRVRPSVLADHLGRVLGSFPPRRRLDLLLDLWTQVTAHRDAARRRERTLATQARQSRVDDLSQRYTRHEDDLLLSDVRLDIGHEPSVAEAARWIPQTWHWHKYLDRALHDAIAVTALLRAATAVADHGVHEGLARCEPELTAAASLMNDWAAGHAARRVPGLTGLPARPGCLVRDLLRGRSDDLVAQRLARARDYGIVVMEAVTKLLHAVPDSVSEWDGWGLREWRAAAGYTRPPDRWEQPPLFGGDPLAGRPTDSETGRDLLWYADLADALARLHGHDAAVIDYTDTVPGVDYNPRPARPEPFIPRLDSIASAVAGAAQLVSLGASPPQLCRDWTELVNGLVGSVGISVATTGTFRVPAPLAAWDGLLVPGTKVRIDWARDPRTLADWASYMGNCIAGPHYVGDAAKGRCGLAALRDREGRVIANLEVRPVRGGWRVAELQARFNTDPEAALDKRVRHWAARIPPPAVPEPEPEPTVRAARAPSGRPTGRRPHDRVLREVGEPLILLVQDAMTAPEAVQAARTLEVLHGGLSAATALRRLGPDRITPVCRDALVGVGLARLWRATASRPLANALAALDVGHKEAELLGLLVTDAPLPGLLRTLARHPVIAPARSAELVARRIRAALGRLARDGDPALALSVTLQADTALLCALVVAVTSWGAASHTTRVTSPGRTDVPGFPGSDMNDPDGPWQRALPDARELGAEIEAFWEHVAVGGLRAHERWLGNGGWPALWARAARLRALPTASPPL